MPSQHPGTVLTTCVGFIYYATWNFYASHYMPSLPHSGHCGHEGQGFAAATGCAILTSYLFLFIGFYITTYKKSPNKPPVKKAVRRASMCEVPTVMETTEAAVDVIQSTSAAIPEAMGL
jgi:fatty acid elongase 3